VGIAKMNMNPNRMPWSVARSRLTADAIASGTLMKTAISVE